MNWWSLLLAVLRMSDIRMSLKASLAHEAPALVDKEWATDEFWFPFLNKEGRILCPLGLALWTGQWTATQMHELFPWPFRRSKYLPENVQPYQTAAYYRRELVALVSAPMNLTVADSYRSRNLLLRYNSFKYGRIAVQCAIQELQDLVRVNLEYELLTDLPTYGLVPKVP